MEMMSELSLRQLEAGEKDVAVFRKEIAVKWEWRRSSGERVQKEERNFGNTHIICAKAGKGARK